MQTKPGSNIGPIRLGTVGLLAGTYIKGIQPQSVIVFFIPPCGDMQR